MAATEFEELLISYVQEKEFLYDKTNVQYKNVRIKENAWCTIADILNSDAETVKKKWDNLRDRFVRALRDSTAIPPSGSGAQQKKNNFSLYNSMLWLAPYIRKRKMTSTVSSLDVTPSTSVEATSEAMHLSDEASTSTESPAPMQESSLGGSFQEEFRPKRANLHDTLSKVVDSFTSFVATRDYSGPSDLNFMKSVLEDMKMIPHKDKFKFKKEVLNLLEKYIP
ncbi:uncharacterized protein [Periplaneta americana]|uniref:uncharacterized protein n=1 Tax=Periplaneta americana TaxID=6978 RepID=UPI0037E94536